MLEQTKRVRNVFSRAIKKNDYRVKVIMDITFQTYKL